MGDEASKPSEKGTILALLRFNPIQFIFWANVLAGVLAPVMVALLDLAYL